MSDVYYMKKVAGFFLRRPRSYVENKMRCKENADMVTVVDNRIINAALDLRSKVDTALSMGIPAEIIGAALMVEKGLDPGITDGPVPSSLDALLSSGVPA